MASFLNYDTSVVIGNIPVSTYNISVIIYDRRGVIRLAAVWNPLSMILGISAAFSLDENHQLIFKHF